MLYSSLFKFQIDDDFMAKYQMSYGQWVEPSTPKNPKVEIKTKADIKEEKEQKKAEAKRKAAEPPTWFEIDEAHNTAVYISGLPLDITIDELVEIVTKYGMLLRDDKNKPKLKLYMDADGQPKGDALCTYIKVSKLFFYSIYSFLFSHTFYFTRFYYDTSNITKFRIVK